MPDLASARIQRVALHVQPQDIFPDGLPSVEADLHAGDSHAPQTDDSGSCSALSKAGDILIKPWIYWLFHSYRLFGYALVVPPMMYLKPLKTATVLATYAAIHRQLWWQRAVHKFLGYGASDQHKIVNHNKHLIHDDERYLWSLHPHSVLADGWHSIIANNVDSFEIGPPEIGRKIALCFAPIIQHVPVHQEMYRDKCGAADKKSVTSWWKTDADPALIPGGFAESVFANATDTKYEYSYIKDRQGFIRIAIEAGHDIVPCYTFRATRMYYNPAYLRGWRARFSQSYYIGLVPFVGWMGTSMPLTDKTTTVVFPPFHASKYTVKDLDQAHRDYMEHLKKHFDLNKAHYGMRNTELVFVGSDWEDDDFIARALTKMGVLTPVDKPRAKL